MNQNSNNYLNNLYTHLNSNQSYYTYSSNINTHTHTHTQTNYINQSIYDKILHDFQYQ